MLKTLLVLFLIAPLTGDASFEYPTYEGKPFEVSDRNADIACFLLTFNTEEFSMKAKSYDSRRVSHNELPEDCLFSGEAWGERVAVIDKTSEWIGFGTRYQVPDIII